MNDENYDLELGEMGASKAYPPPLRSSPAIDALAAALAKAQSVMKHPSKNKIAKVPMKTGGSYSYSYADLADCLDAVRVPFAANGLSVVQIPFNEGPNAVGIVTRIMHSSGQWIEGTLFMPCADSKPQTIGSAITYGRRYAISPMAGIASDDDDDGSAAQGIEAETSSKKVIKPEVLSTYDGETTILKNQFLSIAKKLGILKIEDLQAASRACKGLQMVDLEAALKEWKQDNKK